MRNPPTVSILMPVYNEAKTIQEIIERVKSVELNGLRKELIIVDDGSKDGTREYLQKLPTSDEQKIYFHAHNMGKGAALRTGLHYTTGDIVLIQDADLEYDPAEYPELLKPILDGRADVVYGSRLTGGKVRRDFNFLHLVGNKFLTLLTNILYNTTLTDMETCYKVFRADVVKSFQIKSNRFNFEPEITAKVLKRKYKLYELPISYYGRDFDEGKKITWRDGFSAVWSLVKYRFMD
ncbi:MAG TPA: glycosyltransferase family 2 protein [Blastocatellia bacterium]|nr:glycosyltransferase family 2 protein [Blastocatellia bacterium]